MLLEVTSKEAQQVVAAQLTHAIDLLQSVQTSLRAGDVSKAKEAFKEGQAEINRAVKNINAIICPKHEGH